MKIVFLDIESLGKDISFNPIEKFGEFLSYDHTYPQEVKERIKDAQILIVNKVIIGKEQIDSAPNLRLLCVAATGTNNIDMGYAAEKKIVVRNAVNYSTESVVQTTFAALLTLMTNIQYFDNCVKSGTYSNSKHFTDTGRTFNELYGKTIGIIGMGTIGKRVAQVASVFGAKVVYYSTNRVAHCDDYFSVSLEELLINSDVISIHAPLNEKTTNLIALEQIQQMKKEAIIVNMGRGGIVNESDLVTALNSNIISGAVIDVYTKEPISANHIYFNIKDKSKVILTPHIAWSSIQARNRLVSKIAENIQRFIQEENPAPFS